MVSKWSSTTLAPFLVLAVILGFFFFAKGGKCRQAVMAEPNFYIIAVMVVALLSMWANWRPGMDWRDKFTWGVAILASVACGWKLYSWEPGKPADRGPLN